MFSEFRRRGDGHTEPDDAAHPIQGTQLLLHERQHIEGGRVRPDPGAEKIIQAAQEEGVDLIVLGSHGRSGLASLLMGSVAERVTATVKCPVLVAKLPEDLARIISVKA